MTMTVMTIRRTRIMCHHRTRTAMTTTTTTVTTTMGVVVLMMSTLHKVTTQIAMPTTERTNTKTRKEVLTGRATMTTTAKKTMTAMATTMAAMTGMHYQRRWLPPSPVMTTATTTTKRKARMAMMLRRRQQLAMSWPKMTAVLYPHSRHQLILPAAGAGATIPAMAATLVVPGLWSSRWRLPTRGVWRSRSGRWAGCSRGSTPPPWSTTQRIKSWP
mmetsp:Transcript_37241/g.63409  ORF Transcript_37241/g.63409 Transcript_37241/m.63409 type:complete len:216 (+) Transcript_37241:483-1130(+)